MRRTLALPILLPAAVTVLVGGLALLGLLPDDLLELGGGAAMILLYAFTVYLVPYLVVAIPLWIRAPRMDRGAVVLALWLTPAVVTVLTALGASIGKSVAGWRIVAASAPEIGVLGLVFGYSYAVFGWLYLRSRVPPAPARPTPGAFPTA